MKEQDLLRQAIAPDLPDMDQVRQKILHGNAPKVQRKNLRSVLPAAACIALLLTATVLFPQWDPLSKHFAAAAPGSSEKAGSEERSGSAHVTGLTPEIYFNELGDHSISANRLYFDPEETYEKQMTFTELVDYLGRDIRPAFIPQGLQSISVEDMNFTMIYNNDGTILYDQTSFFYQEKPNRPDYDPLERRLVISVSKMQLCNECVYAWPKDMQKTCLNGHTVQLGKCKMPYGPYTVVESGENTPAGYYDLLIAQFQFAGLDYGVRAENLTEAEFVEILTSMLPPDTK